jgi:hypothetical protein
MPQAPIGPSNPNPIGPSNPQKGQLAYPTDLLRQTAAKILANADAALTDHQSIWNKIQLYYLDPHPQLGQFMIEVLDPHQKRLAAAFQWQIDLATTIFSMVDLIEGTDNDVKQSFQGGHGHQPG